MADGVSRFIVGMNVSKKTSYMFERQQNQLYCIPDEREAAPENACHFAAGESLVNATEKARQF